jgi:hypothetical protein
MKKRIVTQNPKCHKALENRKYYHKPKSSIKRGKKDKITGDNSTEGKGIKL